jgi:hypothetical protein
LSRGEALNWLAAHPGWHKTLVVASGLGKRRHRAGPILTALADHGDIKRRLLGEGAYGRAGVVDLSYLQDRIMEYLRQHPEGATVETIAEGIGSTKHVLWPSIRGLERWKMVESERAEHGKIWRATWSVIK